MNSVNNLSRLISASLMAIGLFANTPCIAKEQSEADEENYTTIVLNEITRHEIANKLGWVSDHSAQNLCYGYYQEPVLYYDENPSVPINKSPIHINFDSSVLSGEDRSIFKGNVILTQPNRYISADLMHLDRNPETGKYSSVDVYGNVYLREPGKLVIGDKGHVNLEENSGSLNHVIYRLTRRNYKGPEGDEALSLDHINIEQLTGWGIAARAIREPDGVLRIIRGTYTTCPPTKHTWMIKANNLRLNKITGRGSASGASLYFHDRPIVYTPYMNFPIDNRRQTGFLFPSAGNTSNSGNHLSLPFYWNIAPNYDATITPDIMSERGTQFNGEFRYLTHHSEGNIHGSILPNDREFSEEKNKWLEEYAIGTPSRSRLANSNDTRHFISWLDHRVYSPHWSSYLYLNRASDDYYFIDFADDPAQITDNQIINQADLRYVSTHWNFIGRLQGYQTLHPITQGPVDNQYRKLPELLLDGYYHHAPYHTAWRFKNSFDYFDKLKNPGTDYQPVTGDRLNINPAVALPMHSIYGFFNPQIQVSGTNYDLHHQMMDRSESITRVLPIANLDAGLFFERDLFVGPFSYRQTLEPRLFYLYVPYENQDDIPLFDTGVQPFKFAQLFRTNRFSGIDRIGDANQLSIALTSRLLNQDNGEEKLRASIGQIVYFDNRKVNIEPSSGDLVSIANSVPPDTTASPIVGELDYHINRHWNLHSEGAWDPNFNQVNNASIMFQYRQDNRHLFNLGYNFLRGGDEIPSRQPKTIKQRIDDSSNDLNQIAVSTVWPITRRWSWLGSYMYNISHHYAQTGFAGIQYESCCWAIRLIGGREWDQLKLQNNGNTSRKYNKVVFLEFALKGLGSAHANNPHKLLATNIAGYDDQFGVF